jgi:hypothetical protein
MKEKVSHLSVVFDTSIIWNQVVHDLVSKEVAEIIQNNKYPDLEITWYLPDIVRHERIYQMQEEARNLLISIAKIEKLLDHNLNLPESFIQHRILECVNSRETSLGITSLALDVSRVDWNRVKLDAIYRNAPFEKGKTEKGFRDAMIVESFFQLVEQLPTSIKQRRIAFVTGDDLMANSVINRAPESSNIRVYRSLEELQGLINTLVSEVDEEFIQKYRAKAETLFFDSTETDAKTLWAKHKLQEHISLLLKQNLSAKLPDEANGFDDNKWLIHSPNFIKKISQRIFWSTRIEIEVETFRYEEVTKRTVDNPHTPAWYAGPALSYVSSNALFSDQNPLNANFMINTQIPNRFQMAYPTLMSKRVKIRKGLCVLEIPWSMTLSTAGKLTKPTIEAPKFMDAVWDNEQNAKS